MDFREVCDIFGGSVFVEEPRGSFIEAWKRIEQREASRSSANADEEAAVLLLKTVHAALIGQFVSDNDQHCCKTYLQLFRKGSFGPRWEFRFGAYTLLLSSWQFYPPLFRFCTLESGPSSMLLEATGNIHAQNVSILNWCLNNIERVEPLDKLEFGIIREVWTLSHRGLEAARMVNPTYPYNTLRAKSKTYLPEVFQSCAARFNDVKDLAATLDLPQIAGYADRLLWEIAQAQGCCDTLERLHLLQEKYKMSNDLIGAATCVVLRGDSTLCGPFTNPIALNLLPVDGWDYLGSDTSLDELYYAAQMMRQQSSGVEIDYIARSVPVSMAPLTYTRLDQLEKGRDAAITLYKEAEEVFSTAKSLRGQALAMFHHACTLFIRELHPEAHWEEREPNVFEPISHLYKRASMLFESAGDMIHSRITQTHLLLLAAYAKENIYSLDCDIGKWGYEHGNWVHARQLGLLAFRLGDHCHYALGDSFGARLSYDCANFILAEIPEQRSPLFQLQCSIVLLCLSINNRWRGKIALETAISAFGHMQKEFATAAEKDDSWGSANQFFASVLVDLHLTSCQKWETAKSMEDICARQLKMVELLGSRQPSDKVWLARKRYALRMYVLLSNFDQELEYGGRNDGEDGMEDFLERTDTSEDLDIDAKLARVDMCLRIQDLDTARNILNKIDEGELLTEFKMGMISVQESQDYIYMRRRSIRAFESKLQRCVDAACWEKAVRLAEQLRGISPDHFIFPGNYSHVEPWQRLLWAGFLDELQEQFALSYLCFRNSMLVFHQHLRELVDPGERALYLSHHDYNRISASLARFHIRRHKQEPPLLTIQPYKIDGSTTRIIARWNQQVDLSDEGALVDALEALETGKALSVARSATFNLASDRLDAGKEYERYHRFRAWIDLMTLKRSRSDSEEREYQELNEGPQKVEMQSNPIQRDNRPLNDHLLQYPKLLYGVPNRAVVIYISLCKDGLAVIIIDGTAILAASWNADISSSATRTMVSLYLGALIRDKFNASKEYLATLALSMSAVFIEPFAAHIRGKDHVIFVPSGDLARFPLGALYLDELPLILQMTVSTVPSLSILTQLGRRPVTARASVSVIARPGNAGKSPKEAESEPALPFAGIEALLVGQMLGSWPLDASRVSKGQFKEEMNKSSIVHLCTHGYIDSAAPMLSHISLEKKFRVLDMLMVRTAAPLVIFGACTSSAGEVNPSDDMTGFPHAVLAAGAHVFIGALWSSNDLVALLQTVFFYAQILNAREPRPVAEMWQRSIATLFGTTSEQVTSLLQSFIRRWDEMEAEGLLPGAFVKNGRRKLQKAIDEWILPSGEPTLDLKHPYFWANFVMIGNANFKMYTRREEEV